MKHTTPVVFTLTMTILLMTAVSCAGEGTSDVTDAAKTTDVQTETAAISGADAILSQYEARDLSGMPVTILTSNRLNDTIYVRTAPESDAVGELVNDALFARDRMLEDYFGTTINWRIADSEANSSLLDVFRDEVLAGDSTFHFMIGSVKESCLPAFNEGLCVNLAQMPHINLENPWWSRNVMDNFIYNDAYYMLVGEFSPRNVLAGNMLIFNLRECANRDLPSFYDMVRDGTWTYDAFLEIVRGTAADLNADGKIKYGDFFGMNCDSTTAHSFYFGMGQTLMDESLQANVMTPTAVSVIENLQDLFASQDVDAKSYQSDTYAPNNAFMNGHALFNCMVIIDLSTFRDSETDYGIVPLPKLDETQEDYISLGNIVAMAGLTVPMSADPAEYDNLGLFIEAMTALSHYKSMPEAYEATLLSKETRDEDSVEMLRIVTEGLTIDFGCLYDIGGISTMLRDCVVNGKAVASAYESIEAKIITASEKLIAQFAGE